MQKSRVILGTVLLLLVFVFLPPQFAQNVSPAPKDPDLDKRQALSLIRTINTAELKEHYSHGSYAAWDTLFAHQAEYINQCARLIDLQFGDAPEVLPGWNLRLTVSADSKGYDLLLRDLANKEIPFAAYSNEKGIIWVAKPLE